MLYSLDKGDIEVAPGLTLCPRTMLPVCEVSLEPREIRFIGCQDNEAKIAAAKLRLAIVTRQRSARSGLTNRERRKLRREANILQNYLTPAQFEGLTRRDKTRLLNRRAAALKANLLNKRRKPTKLNAQKARQRYTKQQPIQTRPDYRPAVVMPEAMRVKLIKRRDTKLGWFQRKHGDNASQTTGTSCAKMTQVITASQGDKLE